MISGNIANADTPFYKSRDLSFEDALQKEASKIFNGDKSQKLELAKTNSNHLNPQDWDSPSKPDIFFRDGHLVRNDGNTVDLDIESSEMSKNNIMYNAVMSGIKKEGTIFASVIQASQSTQ
jgi:flagellar basal-body rod protein FlgB